MASREELYQALRNADASGDADGARKLAAYIQSLPLDQPAQPAETAAQAGKRYRDVFRDNSLPQQVLRAGLMDTEALGKAALSIPLLAEEGGYRAFNALRRLAGYDPVQTPYEAIAQREQQLGLEPQNAAERYITQALGGIGGAAGLAGAAGAVAGAIKNPTVAKAVLTQVAERPGLAAASGATSAVSSQTAHDLHAGPIAQAAAGLVGGLVPGAGTAVVNAARSAVTASRAPQILADRLDASGMQPGDAANIIRDDQTVAELSKPLADLAGAVIRRSPAAAQRADALTEARAPQRTADLVGRIDSDIAGTSATARQTDDALLEMQRASEPFYERANALSPKISIPADLTRRDSIIRAYGVAQQMAKENGSSLPDINPNAVQPIPPLTLNQADLVKRAMDDVIYNGRQPLSGIGKQQLGAMDASRADLVKAIDQQAHKSYAQARAIYAGPARTREALEAGLDSGNMTAEDISRYLADPELSAMERRAFQIGAANAAKQKIAKASDAREAANLFASPNAQQSLGILSNENPPFLPELIRRQRQQARFEQQLQGGTQTQPRAAADAALGEELPEPPTKQAIVQRLLQWATDRTMPSSKRTLSDLSDLLLNPNGVENADVLRRLQLQQAMGKIQPQRIDAPDIAVLRSGGMPEPIYAAPSATGSINALQFLMAPQQNNKLPPLLERR